MSITTADFCNPGWKGYFPLVLRNDGTHTIVIHPNEKMLQLMLLPTEAPIIVPYHHNSTYMNDDGTPYKFWEAQTAKKLRKSLGSDDIVNFYAKMCKIYEESEIDSGMHKRFEDSFLTYCDKRKHKRNFRTQEDKVDPEKLYDSYINREKWLDKVFSQVKTVIAGIVALLSLITSFLSWIFPEPDRDFFKKLAPFRLPLLIFAIALIIYVIISVARAPKAFCTVKKSISIK